MFPSLQDWWDRGKELLKRLALQHCSRARHDRCLSRSVQCASHLKGKIDDGTVSLLPVYERVLAQLAAFDLTEAEGTRIRSLVKWAEEGETSSRYFLRLERKRDTCNSAMKTSDGSIVSDIVGI